MPAPPPDRVPIETLLAHRAWVRSLARNLVSDPSRADDVEQETWRVVLERPPQHAGALRAWFARVVRNVARSVGRGETRRERRESAHPVRPGAPSPCDVVTEAELQHRLAAAVLALDEPYRSTVLRRWFEGKEPAQIAADEGVPVATVRTRMKRGVRQLRARMHAEIGDDRRAWSLLLTGNSEAPAAATGTHSAPGSTAGIITHSAAGAAMGWGTKLTAAGVLLLFAGVVAVVGHTASDEFATSTAGAWSGGDAARQPGARRDRGARRGDGEDPTHGIAVDRVAPSGNLRGTVVRADGTAVAGADVVAESFPWQRISKLNWRALGESVVEGRTSSAADGSFALHTRDAGSQQLRVTAEGCAPTLAGPFVGQEPIRIVVGPGVTLRAEVRNEAGEPVVGAGLFLIGKRERLMDDAVTDAHGFCTFDGLAGSARVMIVPAADVGPFEPVMVDLPRAGETTVRVVSPSGGTVRGRVLDAVTEAPIPGASVGQEIVLLARETTDAEGWFELTGWNEDSLRKVHVVADGYSRACVALDDATPIVIRLDRGFSVEGRLVNASGSPLAGARIAVEANDRGNGSPRRTSCGFAVTRADGTFRIEDLTRDLQHVFAAVCPEGAIARRAIDARPEEEGDTFDLGEIALMPTGAIGGTVVLQHGDPAEGVTVRLRGPLDEGGAALDGGRVLASDAAGQFRFDDLSPGRYAISADPPGAAGVELAVVLPPDQDLVGVRIPPVSDEQPLVVRVVDDRGVPMPDVRVGARRARSGTEVFATSDVSGVAQFATRADAPFSHLRVAGSDLNQPAARLAPGARSHELVVDRSAQVTCRLVDTAGRPIEGASLRVVPPRTAMIPFTDANGRVTFAIPARGEVSVRFDGTVPGSEMLLLQARVDHVTADSGPVDLRCTPVTTGNSLFVRVLAVDGSAIAGMSVRLWSYTAEVHDTETDAAGLASFHDLPSREFSVLVLPGPGRYGPRGLRVVPDGQEFVAQFPEVQVVEGEVVWESGGAAADVSVTVFSHDARGQPRSHSLGASDDHGRFAVEVPADDSGPFRIRVHAVRGDLQVAQDRDGVQPGQPVRIVLDPE